MILRTLNLLFDNLFLTKPMPVILVVPQLASVNFCNDIHPDVVIQDKYSIFIHSAQFK